MGNSASTEHQTKPTTSSTAAATTETKDHQLLFSISNNNLKQYSEELSTEQRQQQQQQEQKQDDPSALPIGHSQTPFQLSITEPTTTATTTNTMTNPNTTASTGSGWTSSTSNTVPIDTTSSPKPVPGKSGWVSSTGASSPWYGGGSLSSSASSTHHPQPSSASYQQQSQRSHRQSISKPYYRARGLSVNQQQEPTEEDLISSSSSAYQPLQQPSPSVSTAQQQQHQPPRLQLQQLQLNSSSPASPVSYSKSDAFPKEKAPTDSGVPTIITWTQGGDNVYVTGTFNGWKHKIKLVKSTHDFNTVVDLPLGTHRLKFIVDDEWKCSNDMETATDPDGNLVNYLQVMDEDDMEDELGQNTSLGGGGNKSTSTKDEEEYTSVIPKELLLLSEAMQQKDGGDATTATDGGGSGMDPQQKRNILEWERKQPQPPSLPPHLEKVLLNSHAVSNEDNSVLPVPHHVTLNHLYACSIKDHVMALSSTTRYRKKYVTTMYYRPV